MQKENRLKKSEFMSDHYFAKEELSFQLHFWMWSGKERSFFKAETARERAVVLVFF
jgi:hypothetical protein